LTVSVSLHPPPRSTLFPYTTLFRSVLYLADPAGCSPKFRRQMLDDIAELNLMSFQQHGDPETQSRIEQYEMAFRMQSSVPELTRSEEHTSELQSRENLVCRLLLEKK